MQIKKFSFTDRTMGWELQPLSFDQLTLLVGASGVGKTRILRSILDVRRIATGKSINGVNWHIEFLAGSGRKYTWEGSFEDKGFSAENIFGFDDEDEKEKPRIERERVYIDDKLVIDRNTDGILFNGTKTVKLSKNESAVFLLREEEQIQEAYQEFDKVIFDDNANDINRLASRLAFDEEVEDKIKKYQSIKTIRECNENVELKLYFTYKNQKEYFEDISQSFTDVFPYVEEIKIESISQNKKILPFFIREMPFIQIKEKGIENWIPQTRMSSGMLRTLVHIAELYLCADSSLILIDEFENSLGINCIDELTSSIVSAERNLQFIITSHHPYIINNIKPKDWKIITRKAGSVISHDAGEFNFDKSKHKAFTQLINLDLYSEGVES